MKPLLDFKKNDTNDQRFDNLEGSLSNHYSKNGELYLKPENESQPKKIKIFEANFNKTLSDTSIHSYSLYSITAEELLAKDTLTIDPRMQEFGSHFLLIQKPGEFVRKVKQYFIENKMEYRLGHVNYYDSKKNFESLTLFDKPLHLSHQKEFRFLTKSPLVSPIKFHIGSLEEFSEVFSTDNLEKFKMGLKCG